MAMHRETVVEKVERLLGAYGAMTDTAERHALRLASARKKLDVIAGDLEMYVQHRAVGDDLRERVSEALAAQVPGVESDERSADDSVNA